MSRSFEKSDGGLKLDVLRKSVEGALGEAGIEDAESESYSIIFEIFGLDPVSYLLRRDSRVCKAEELEALNDCVERRKKREPLQYIFGRWRFMDCEFYVGGGVFIPREDTRVLVELAIEHLKGARSAAAVDLCSGSGAVAINIKKRTSAKVAAIEKSPMAFEYLKKNIAHNRVEVTALRADVFDAAEAFEDGSLDLIASNPPYIESGEIESLQREVLFEPRLALDGGEDGLYYYRRITPLWKPKLRRGGALAFELGEDQSGAVREIMEKNGFADIRTARDIAGTERAVMGVIP